MAHKDTIKKKTQLRRILDEKHLMVFAAWQLANKFGTWRTIQVEIYF